MRSTSTSANNGLRRARHDALEGVPHAGASTTPARPGGTMVQAWLVPLGALALLALGAGALIPGVRQRARLWLGAAGGPPVGAEVVRVIDVVDGDTLVVEGGRSVRVLGIDTPETHNPSLSGPQPLGFEAAARLAELVASGEVGLERDATEVDHYGRELRHVWVGGHLVAERLLAEGLGRALVIPPDTRHADRLRAAEAEARAGGAGLWGLPRPTALPIFGSPEGEQGGSGRR